MNEASQERYPVIRIYQDKKQHEGYRDFIEVIEIPSGDGIRIGVGGRVVTKPIGEWVKLGWQEVEPLSPTNRTDEASVNDVEQKLKAILLDLKHVGHHTVEEELWRIEKLLLQVRSETLEEAAKVAETTHAYMEEWGYQRREIAKAIRQLKEKVK